jgi:hypothetical protein
MTVWMADLSVHLIGSLLLLALSQSLLFVDRTAATPAIESCGGSVRVRQALPIGTTSIVR